MKNRLWPKVLSAGFAAACLLPGVILGVTNNGYIHVNLVSNATNAPHVDARLLNPWGVEIIGGTVWVNDNHSGLTTSYTQTGRKLPATIHIPAPGGGVGAPSGLAFNGTGQFVITNGSRHAAATFLMSTEDGTITAWNQRVTGSNAVIVVDNSAAGAVYKGLAIAKATNGAALVFAANFFAGTIDVYDTHFQLVNTLSDQNLPGAFAPFNIRTIRGKLFVTFAKQLLPAAHDDQAGPGNGFVDIFDTDGTLLRRFASHGALNSPWGLAVAPKNFGRFHGALLVGNFGDGAINAYDLLTGHLLGPLTDPAGTPLAIDGLWGLMFDRQETSERECEFSALRLYFTAGPNVEADGLLGAIHAVTPSGR